MKINGPRVILRATMRFSRPVSFAISSLVMLAPFARAETLSGKVVGPDDKPLAATVYFVMNGGWEATQKQVQAAADGTFSFEVQPYKRPGQTAAVPTPAGKAMGGAAAFAPGLSLALAFLEADAPSTLKLTPPRKVSGVLKDEKGAVVAGATLKVSHFFHSAGERRERRYLFFNTPADLSAQFTAKTDAQGGWEISGAPLKDSVSVEIDDDDYVDAGAQFDAEGALSGPGRQKIIARRAGTLSGRVLDERGEPAQGVAVFASPKTGEKNGRGGGALAKTGKDGTYRIPRLAPGAYDLLISNLANPYAMPVEAKTGAVSPAPRIAPALENVTAQAGKVAGGNDFTLVAPALVKGRVLDATTGLPLAEVAVGAFGKGAPRGVGMMAGTTTDSEGRFELALVPGDNAVYAYETERFGNSTPKDATATPLKLKAGANAPLSLRIERRFADLVGETVFEDGKPAPGVDITVWNPNGTGQSLRSDEKGHFDLKRLQLGAQRLDPSDQWTVVTPKNLVLPATAAVKIVVKRNEMARVTVRIVDGQGKPVEGVKMRFSMPIELEGDRARNARSIYSPVSDQSGTYVFEALKLPNALELKLESAAKKGYKLRPGGGVFAGAGIGNKTVTLADIVMESLGGVLKGTIKGANGVAIAGALVRSSGDDFENVATSDAAGHFELRDQPQGALEVLAAQGRSFGRLQTQSDAANAEVTLQSAAAVAPRDVERAVALFREMAPSSNDRTLGDAAQALGPFQPAAALEILLLDPKIKPDDARSRVIGTLSEQSSDENLSWAQRELAQIEGDAVFLRAGAYLGGLLAKRDPKVATAIFEAMQTRRAKIGGAEALPAVARVAALAARLELPVAPRLFDEALAGGLRAPDELKNLVEPLAAGGTALAMAILDELTPGKESNIYLYRQAIQQVARYDAAGAQKLLAQMRVLVDAVPLKPDENGQYRGRAALEFDYAFAAKDVLRALPRNEVAAATQIARQVQGWHRVSALALAAEFGTKEERLSMAKEAVEAESRGDWMVTVTKPRLGTLVAELDAPTATQLFADTAVTLADNRREHGSSNASDWSFYTGFWDAAQGRLALESEWTRLGKKVPDPDDKFRNTPWEQSSLAMAMSSIDLDRAVEMARGLSDKQAPYNPSPRARALEFIGEFLLQEPVKRRLLIISPESGFDN